MATARPIPEFAPVTSAFCPTRAFGTGLKDAGDGAFECILVWFTSFLLHMRRHWCPLWLSDSRAGSSRQKSHASDSRSSDRLLCNIGGLKCCGQAWAALLSSVGRKAEAHLVGAPARSSKQKSAGARTLLLPTHAIEGVAIPS